MIDTEYRDRLQADILAAIVAASHDPTTGVPVLRTGEIFEAMTTVFAGFMASSAETSSPTKTRNLCDQFARRLQRKIAGIKEAGGLPFVVVDAATLHAATAHKARH